MKTEHRIIGEYTSGNSGPLFFVTAAVHGNEPSGVKALQNVFEVLDKDKPSINGEFVGVKGNLEALKNNERYIDEDLNRTWKKENITSKITTTHEKQEMFDIIKTLESYSEENYTKRYFLDCHTTSSASLPYMSVQDVNDNDAWAKNFPTYIVRGFSDIVSGSIDHYFSRIGMTGFTFEAGQHTSKDAIDYHEGLIWLALKEACNLDLNNLKNYPEAVTKIKKLSEIKKTLDIVYRHGLKENDSFTMQPDYKNFQEIEKGEFLAIHNGKKITSNYNGHIFMPLYQSQGNDGFFIVQET